jgi:hypothetical protein
MTVTSTNYSSLEEVWGDTFSQKKKEKRKKVVDPICELYEMGNNNGYTENDLVNYANSYFDRHDKNVYQRPVNDTYTRERPVKHVSVRSNGDIEDDKEFVDTDHSISTPLPRTSHPSSHPNSQPNHMNYDDEEYAPKFAFIDLLLYIVSGIILIFVMEQFVKIGMLLQ